MAHVRYNQILTHSYTTLGLSCRFSISGLIFFCFGGGGGRSLPPPPPPQSPLGIARQRSRENFQFRPY